MRGYEACQNQDEIVASLGYDAERDTDNPASSVFCDHGGSITIPWNEVPAHVHCDSGIRLGEEPIEEAPAPLPRRGIGAGGAYAEDKELQDIFERTYGKVERRAFEPSKKPARTSLADHYDVAIHSEDTEYLLVDGYNIIFAWDELHRLAAQDVAAARGALIDILANYQGFRKCRVIVVFDAYKVKGNPGSVQTVHGVKVVYTKEAETADAYIERATYELRRERRVRVATSDGRSRSSSSATARARLRPRVSCRGRGRRGADQRRAAKPDEPSAQRTHHQKQRKAQAITEGPRRLFRRGPCS